VKFSFFLAFLQPNMTAKLFLAALLAAFSAGNAAADPAAELIAVQCFACHGEDGASKGAQPPLRGLPASFIEASLKDYKAGRRPGTLMDRIAGGFSDDELAAVAKYFAGLQP
jgi:sulfide dehydrogenase cytochrome subunit